MNIETPRSQEAQPGVSIEFFNPEENSWEDVREAILRLEEECFPGGGFEEEYLKENFENPKSIVVLLKSEGKIIGFSYAIPDEDVEGAVYIDTTEILPDEQNKKHVVSIMNALEGEARNRGYTYLTRNAAIENGYADKIAKNYEGKILETSDNDSEWGPQRYFKIAL